MAYTRLKYIESNGTQWIDTGFNPDGNTRIVVDFQGLKWNTNEVCMWMGVSSSPSFMFGKASSSNYRAYFYYKTSEVLFSESTAKEWETRQTLDWNKNVVTWGGISKSVSSSTFQCVDNAYLFAANNGGEAKFITRGRIYGCQIYDNDILIRDYIPMANEQGVCGLYDNVSHVFYTSPNGNNFFGVREDNGLPVGYTQCEYIESNGTQYIDTGVIGQANIKAESEFMLMEGGASIPLGCYSPSRLYMISFDSNTYLRYGYSEWVNTSTKVEIGRKYSISVDFASGNQSMVLDGVTIASSSISGRVTNNYNIYAFAYNDGGRAGDFSKIKLYGLKLYQDGLLVRDYIPCQNSEGDYGLYDLVNNVFYQSASEYGFTGKWAEDKKLLVSPSEFRKRLMMLAVTDKKPDYSKLRGVFIEDIDGCLYTQSEWDGSKIPNGVAVLANNCRFVVYGYYPQNSLFDYQGSILYNANYVYDSYPTFGYGNMTTDYNGKNNTDRICSMEGLDSWSIAVKCRNTVFPNGQYGYLAAAGEWKELLNNFNEVNNALSKAGMKRLDIYSQMFWLTSTCYTTGSGQYAYFFAFNMDYKNAETVSVYSEQYSRPLTKLKFDN